MHKLVVEGVAALSVMVIIIVLILQINFIIAQVFESYYSMGSVASQGIFDAIAPFYGLCQTIAFTFLITYTLWQFTKIIFNYLGFEEPETPEKILFKLIFYGTMIYQANQILSLIISTIFNNFYEALVSSSSLNIFTTLGRNIITTAMEFEYLKFAIFIFLSLKMLGIAITFAERLVLLFLLMALSPLAFFAAIGKSSMPYFTNYFKVLTAILIGQLVQLTFVFAILPFAFNITLTGGLANAITGLAIILGFIKIVSNVDELLADISFSTAIGNSTMNLFQNISVIKDTIGKLR